VAVWTGYDEKQPFGRNRNGETGAFGRPAELEKSRQAIGSAYETSWR